MIVMLGREFKMVGHEDGKKRKEKKRKEKKRKEVKERKFRALSKSKAAAYRWAASSKRNWGTCVVLPQPVSPDSSTTWWLLMVERISSLILAAGSVAANFASLLSAPRGGSLLTKL